MRDTARILAVMAMAALQIGTSTPPSWSKGARPDQAGTRQQSGCGKPLFGSTVKDPKLAVRPEAISQNKWSTCYFLAALAALAKINPGAIVDMIETNENGTYTVTFPGAPDEPITIEPLSNSDLSSSKLGANMLDYDFGIWPSVLEKAYGVYCAKSLTRRCFTRFRQSMVPQENAEYMSNLFEHPGIRILTGGSVTSDFTMLTTYASMSRKLQEAAKNSKPAVFSIMGETASVNGLGGRHHYAVLGFDESANPEDSTVVLFNPWGNGEPYNEKGKALDGKDDGIFTMTLKQVSEVFSRMYIADKSMEPAPADCARENASAAEPYAAAVKDDGRAVVSEIPGGVRVTTQKGRPTITELPDGTKIKTYGDGTIATERPDRSYHLASPDGSQYWEKPDGTRIWLHADGARETHRRDGSKVMVRPDGSVIETSMVPVSPTISNIAFAPVESEVQAGNIRCTIYGDDQTTTKSLLVLANATGRTEHLHLSKFECFVPVNNSQAQVMMSLEDLDLNVPPNGEYAVVIPTICATTKTQLPPLSEGGEYRPKAPGAAFKPVVDIVEASDALDLEGAYGDAPIPEANRKETIRQLSVWMRNGKKEEDRVDRVSVARDLSAEAGIQESKLSRAAKRKLYSIVGSLMSTVEKTCQRAAR